MDQDELLTHEYGHVSDEEQLTGPGDASEDVKAPPGFPRGGGTDDLDDWPEFKRRVHEKFKEGKKAAEEARNDQADQDEKSRHDEVGVRGADDEARNRRAKDEG